MSNVMEVFKRLENLVQTGNENQLLVNILEDTYKFIKSANGDSEIIDKYIVLKSYLNDIIKEIDILATEIKENEILISVKNQKTVRTCYQIITSFGVSTCLIPGLGINLSKRCASAYLLSHIVLRDEQKYEILTTCTNFLYRSYNVPVLKNMIITFHLSDYLAALIQLAFAPLKKPGIYPNFTMSEEMYKKLNFERQKYAYIYENLVNNCFQPILMKELMILQSVTDPTPPLFVKKVISKEMSRRLTTPGGLLSLTRCFIETNDMDVGTEWKKIDTICKIVCTKHGNMTEVEYLRNIISQLKQILLLNNEHYLATVTSCLLNLMEKFSEIECVKDAANEIFTSLDYEKLLLKTQFPGTIILSPQEVDRNIQVLHACANLINMNIPPHFISPNLYVLFLLSMKCTRKETKSKIHNVIIKGLELVSESELKNIIKKFLFGWKHLKPLDILIEEYEVGLAIKCSSSVTGYQLDTAAIQFVDMFKLTFNAALVKNVFESCLHIFIELSKKRQKDMKQTLLLNEEELISEDDGKYAQMLQILADISSSQKVINVLKSDPLMVVTFVENLFMSDNDGANDECRTIALVLLNTVLSDTLKTDELEQSMHKILPLVQEMSQDRSCYISMLCKETISLLLSEYPKRDKSAYQTALADVYHNLLPVRAHGIIELTKLIDKSDPETISKRHYVFCLFQEHLKDADSYMYLASINGLATLAMHCTIDVLSVLCNEYLATSLENDLVETQGNRNNQIELRMKIGDVIVQVTKKLGEMAVVHKTILLNTMLCVSRDEEPLIRASALSNLAEIALVINYRMGTIIYEVLLCIWNIIETDKAIECRRAAVMVVASLLKGLGQEALIELKENILPIYRTLNKLYKDPDEDSVLKLHSQIALEELNDIVTRFLSPRLPVEKQIFMLNNNKDIQFK